MSVKALTDTCRLENVHEYCVERISSYIKRDNTKVKQPRKKDPQTANPSKSVKMSDQLQEKKFLCTPLQKEFMVDMIDLNEKTTL